MAALSGITAVKPLKNTKTGNSVQLGATIAVGQTVYRDVAESQLPAVLLMTGVM